MSETVELRHGKGDVDHELDFNSTDSCPELMQYFLEQLGLPAPDEFVCLSVQLGGKENALVGAYGTPYRLKPEYFEKVRIVCAGDFLNVMSKAIVAYLRKGKPLSEWRDYFTELPASMTTAERLQELRKAEKRKDKIGTYAEARIYGRCDDEWFEPVEPEAGYEDLFDINFDELAE
jgi:hypothetical protein